jgi:cytochrome c-type biogenesis protein
VEELKGSSQAQLMRRVMINSIGFILGFSVVFITLGAISTEIGQVAARYKHTLSIVAGVVILIFGLHLTGIFKIKEGMFLLAIYSLGLAVPFLLTSLGIERFLKFYSRFRSHMHALEVASGGLLIALGVLLVLGRFTLISNWFSFLNRFAL